MTGRGVDQILPHPGDPELREPRVTDASRYVRLVEAVSGPIPRPVDFAYPWGDALAQIDSQRPDLRLINLETSITTSDDFAPGKDVHYRMSPGNLPCLTALRPDVCTLANNHILDLGTQGMLETLETLDRAGIATVGAGIDLERAAAPFVTTDGLAVFGLGLPSSGIPGRWAANDRPGVSLLTDLSPQTTAMVAQQIRAQKAAGTLVIVSIHWGSNWGYEVPTPHIRLAHRLVDAGADLIHGHSSHHPRPAELYRGRLILYGCGDFVDDYEGIPGYDEYRDELRLLYFVTMRPDGRLERLKIVPMRSFRMRLEHAAPEDVRWTHETLSRISRPLGTHVVLSDDGLHISKAGRSRFIC